MAKGTRSKNRKRGVRYDDSGIPAIVRDIQIERDDCALCCLADSIDLINQVMRLRCGLAGVDEVLVDRFSQDEMWLDVG